MQLKYPYRWNERKVILTDGVLFVPDRLESYRPLEIELYPQDRPVHIEYCSGNGAWIADKAEAFPDIFWIAVEKKFDRVRKIWSKVKRRQLSNLLIICGEGLMATSHYIKDSSIAHVYVNFPDPWPKKRHWKHRIIQQPFLDEMRRILGSSGQLTFVTDDAEYSKVMTEELQQASHFTPLSMAPYFVTELIGYGSSYFEELWRAQGKPIFYHQWMLP